MAFHIRPLTRQDAIDHAVTYRPVTPNSMMADDAILLGSQGLNGSLRGQVEIVGTQTNHLTPKRVERMTEQQQLAASVNVATLPPFGIPGVTDLHPIDLGYNIMITGT